MVGNPKNGLRKPNKPVSETKNPVCGNPKNRFGSRCPETHITKETNKIHLAAEPETKKQKNPFGRWAGN